MGAATKKARTVAAPKTPPKAAPKTPPKAAPKAAAAAKAEPDGKPKGKAAAVAKATCRGESHQPGARLDLQLERLGVGSGTAQQAPTCVWTSRKGGKLYLSGLPMRQTAHR